MTFVEEMTSSAIVDGIIFEAQVIIVLKLQHRKIIVDDQKE